MVVVVVCRSVGAAWSRSCVTCAGAELEPDLQPHADRNMDWGRPTITSTLLLVDLPHKTESPTFFTRMINPYESQQYAIIGQPLVGVADWAAGDILVSAPPGGRVSACDHLPAAAAGQDAARK